MITVLGIYIFIVIGFFAKKIFKEIDGKTLVILSTYFLQPFLTLWGIMLVPINFDLILSPLVYLLAVFIALIFTFLFVTFLCSLNISFKTDASYIFIYFFSGSCWR